MGDLDAATKNKAATYLRRAVDQQLNIKEGHESIVLIKNESLIEILPQHYFPDDIRYEEVKKAIADLPAAAFVDIGQESIDSHREYIVRITPKKDYPLAVQELIQESAAKEEALLARFHRKTSSKGIADGDEQLGRG
jgi:hypothetical protein